MTTTTEPSITSTIGQIVAQRPQASRVFEHLGIDYCCGGKETLEEACHAKGLDAATVLSALLSEPAAAHSEPPTNWDSASLTELADHIEQIHHAYLREELPRLEAMVRKVAAVHGQRYAWVLEIDSVFSRFAAEMQSHLLKEEQMLFPLIRALEADKVSTQPEHALDLRHPVEVMKHEHDDAGQSLERMRELSNDFQPPEYACATFRGMLEGLVAVEADTHRHVHKENSILFPKAIVLATERWG